MADSNKTAGKEAGEGNPEAPKAHFDEQGRLPETKVDNIDSLHVHTGQILDKGTSVLQSQQDAPNQQDAPLEIVRAARPTGSDVPDLKNRSMDVEVAHLNAGNEPHGAAADGDNKKKSGGETPEQSARLQTQQQNAKYGTSNTDELAKAGGSPVINDQNPANQVDYTLQGSGIMAGTKVKDHPTMTGEEDGAIPGSRSGNPLTNLAENQLGDKVFSIEQDGSHWLYIKTRDKSRAFYVEGTDPNEPGEFQEITRATVMFSFPAINPKVSQRHLLIMVQGYQPCEMFFPPDVANVEIMVPKNVVIHAELTHIDQGGARTAPYTVDFYSSTRVSPQPLEASPLSYEIGPDILVRIAGETPLDPQPVQGRFGRQAGGGGPSQPSTGEAKKVEEAKAQATTTAHKPPTAPSAPKPLAPAK